MYAKLKQKIIDRIRYFHFQGHTGKVKGQTMQVVELNLGIMPINIVLKFQKEDWLTGEKDFDRTKEYFHFQGHNGY